MKFTYIKTAPKDGGEPTIAVLSDGMPLFVSRDGSVRKILDVVDNDDDLQEGLHNIYVNRSRWKEQNIELISEFEKTEFSEVLSKFDHTTTLMAKLNFMEKVGEITDYVVRHSLLQWMRSNPSLGLTPEGDVVGYRALHDDYTSWHAGYGIINGVATNGHHDCRVGNIIEMPREMVNADPNVTCSFGLHIGTLAYAIGFRNILRGGGQLTVNAFDPRDLVVADTDEKVRVCRYRVLADYDPDIHAHN